MQEPELLAKPSLSVLSPAGVSQIHQATLELLANVGVWVDEPRALQLLAAAGAVAAAPGWTSIPPDLVERAISQAPSKVQLYSRTGQPAVLLGDGAYFGLAGDGPEYLDPRTGTRRSFCLRDARTMAQLASSLDSIAFVELGGLAADVPPAVADRLSFMETISATTKPIGFCTGDSQGLLDILDMASLVAGGEEALRQQPFVWHHAEPVSPLRHTADGLRRLLVCAERQIPVGYMPMAEAGSTAPSTLAGTLVQANAETLSGLVIHQLAKRGAPFVMGGMPGIMDMRTMVVSYAAPELDLMSAALAQMARHYHLPFLTSAGASDAKDIDPQAAAEVALSCLTMAWAGANLVIDTGMLDHSDLISPELAVLVDEVLGMVRKMERGFPLDDDSLALGVMAEAGSQGSFLGHAHTYRNFRQIWYPRLFDRSHEPDGTGRAFRQRLSERTLAVLEGYQPEPMDQKLLADLAALAAGWRG